MIFGYDLDRVFSYTTNRVVIIGDKKLAILYYTLILCAIIYIIAYQMASLESYKKTYQGVGNVFYEINGELLAQSNTSNQTVEKGEYIIETKENNAFIIMTKSYKTSQQMDYCGKKCSSDDDCIEDPPVKYKTCMNSGRCKDYNWCPILEDSYSQLTFKGAENLAISLTSTIYFPEVSNEMYYSTTTKDRIHYPEENANTFYIKDLAGMAKVNLTYIEEHGGIFQISMNWNCDNGDQSCKPVLSVVFMNETNIINPLRRPLGYFVEKSNTIEDKRDYYLHVGIKFQLASHGKLKIFSFYLLVMQLTIFLVLALFIRGLVDFIMVNLCFKRQRNRYHKYKFIDSDDFSDLKEGLEPVKREREDQIKTNLLFD